MHVFSMHTSPTDLPGSGSVGGMNVYLAASTRALAAAGWEVHVFTLRAQPWQTPHKPDAAAAPGPAAHDTRVPHGSETSAAPLREPCLPEGALHRVQELGQGCLVHEIYLPAAHGAAKEDLPAHADAFARACAALVEAPAGSVDASAPTAEGPAGPGAPASFRIPRPRVLHAHYWLSGIAAEAYRELLGATSEQLPLALTLHTTAAGKNSAAGPGEDPEPSHRVEAEAGLIRRAAAVIANTPDERTQLISLCGADPERVHVIFPGVDTELFRPEGPLDRPAPGPFTVVFAARPQPLKGPEILLRAAALARRKVPGLRVQIHGTAAPEYLERLRELARELGLGTGCDFHPASTPEQLARTLRRADAVAMPSSSETFGLVALEAQASGTLVLASDIPGLRIALDDGRVGLLVPARTPEAWAAALEKAARRPELRTHLRRAGLAHARSLTWAQTAQRHAALYRALGGEPAAASPEPAARPAEA